MVSARPALPRVALLFHTNEPAHREILKGILRYVRERGPWSLRVAEERSGEQKLRSFRAWGGAGIVGVVQDRTYADLIRAVKAPAVIIDPIDAALLPRGFLARHLVLASDQRAIGDLAADHFLERGFTHFAYVGTREPINWSRERGAAFAESVATAGFTCETFAPPRTKSVMDNAEADRAELGVWLKALPKPVGVFTAMDIRARQVLDACMMDNLPVPDDVAVLGVDNDTLICESTFPPLSSISLDTEHMGYEAARLLDRLIRNRRTYVPQRILFAPRAVVSRASTDAVLLPDETVRKAIEFIWLHTDDPALGIPQIARQVGLSSRLLEMRFRRVLNRTPLEEVRRTRLRRVRTLLSETDDSIDTIAKACGFANASYLGRIFRQQYNLTPSRFRRASSTNP